MTAARPESRRAVAIEIALGLPLGLGIALATGEPAIWFLLPLGWTLLWRRPLDGLGLRLRATPPSLGVQLAGAVVAAGMTAGFLALLLPGTLVRPQMPDEPARRMLHVLFGTALPEETFFRGWLQERLGVLTRGRRIRGSVEAAVVLQALAFAACHAIVSGPIGWATLGFGLVAGWLRARSGSILAPTLWHAIANLGTAALLGWPGLP